MEQIQTKRFYHNASSLSSELEEQLQSYYDQNKLTLIEQFQADIILLAVCKNFEGITEYHKIIFDSDFTKIEDVSSHPFISEALLKIISQVISPMKNQLSLIQEGFKMQGEKIQKLELEILIALADEDDLAF